VARHEALKKQAHAKAVARQEALEKEKEASAKYLARHEALIYHHNLLTILPNTIPRYILRKAMARQEALEKEKEASAKYLARHRLFLLHRHQEALEQTMTSQEALEKKYDARAKVVARQEALENEKWAIAMAMAHQEALEKAMARQESLEKTMAHQEALAWRYVRSWSLSHASWYFYYDRSEAQWRNDALHDRNMWSMLSSGNQCWYYALAEERCRVRAIQGGKRWEITPREMTRTRTRTRKTFFQIQELIRSMKAASSTSLHNGQPFCEALEKEEASAAGVNVGDVLLSLNARALPPKLDAREYEAVAPKLMALLRGEPIPRRKRFREPPLAVDVDEATQEFQDKPPRRNRFREPLFWGKYSNRAELPIDPYFADHQSARRYYKRLEVQRKTNIIRAYGERLRLRMTWRKLIFAAAATWVEKVQNRQGLFMYFKR